MLGALTLWKFSGVKKIKISAILHTEHCLFSFGCSVEMVARLNSQFIMYSQDHTNRYLSVWRFQQNLESWQYHFLIFFWREISEAESGYVFSAAGFKYSFHT